MIPRLRSLAYAVFQNLDVVDISSLDDVGVERVLSNLEVRSAKGSVLLSYASTLDRLQEYYSTMGRDASAIKINGIVSISETLFEDTRKAISLLFDADCFNRYSNQENGILAQDNGSGPLIVNSVNYQIEILDDEGYPVPMGETGRIVVTDFYNYAMPLIRYDTGDMGSLTTIRTVSGNRMVALAAIEGRKLDSIRNVEGGMISPHAISVAIRQHAGIRKYQFIQKTPQGYRVDIVGAQDCSRDERLDRDLRRILGKVAEIEICYKTDIPLLPSGKHRYIVNECQRRA